MGEEAHLLIGAVRWDSHGRARNGVASIDVAERRAAGERLTVFLKPNPHFRLPADPDRPIIMIGPGTGVAPFRAFLQQREATGARGPHWLFFGARNFTARLPLPARMPGLAEDRGVLTRAWTSRSRATSGRRSTCSTGCGRRGASCSAGSQDGAALYVCGDATAMAKDVHATLLRIVADQSGRAKTAAA